MGVLRQSWGEEPKDVLLRAGVLASKGSISNGVCLTRTHLVCCQCQWSIVTLDDVAGGVVIGRHWDQVIVEIAWSDGRRFAISGHR